MVTSLFLKLMTSLFLLQFGQLATIITPSEQSKLTAEVKVTSDDGSEYHHVQLPIADRPSDVRIVAFDPVDATANIQQAIRAQRTTHRTIIIPYTGQPWIVQPIWLQDELKIILEPGVLLLAKQGAFLGMEDSVFFGNEVKNVTIVGYGATIRMRKEEYRADPYTPSEWRHGIRFWGSTNIKIFGLTIESTGGDAIYLGPTRDSRRLPCANFQIQHCNLDDNYRQGISIVSGVDVVIRDCFITRTTGTAPQAGIDIEASHPNDKAVRISVRNVVVQDNGGSGFLVSIGRMTDKSEPISVVFEDCLVRRTIQSGLRFVMASNLGVTGTVKFINCTIEDSQYPGVTISWDTTSPVQLKFIDCHWLNGGLRRTEPAMLLRLTRSQPTKGGGIEFRNIQISNTLAQDNLIKAILSDTDPWLDVHGDIKVFGIEPASLSPNSFPELRPVFVGATP